MYCEQKHLSVPERVLWFELSSPTLISLEIRAKIHTSLPSSSLEILVIGFFGLMY